MIGVVYKIYHNKRYNTFYDWQGTVVNNIHNFVPPRIIQEFLRNGKIVTYRQGRVKVILMPDEG